MFWKRLSCLVILAASLGCQGDLEQFFFQYPDPDFKLKRVILNTDNVFKPGSHLLTNNAEKSLNALGEKLAEMPKYSAFKFKVFVDDDGSQTEQLELSQTRAEIIASYIWAKHHIPLSRFIEIAGMGSQSPIANPNTFEGEKQNRRLEISIVSDTGAAQ